MSNLEKLALAQLSRWTQSVPSDLRATLPIDLNALGSYWGVNQVIERQLDVAGMLYRLDQNRSVVFLKEDDIPSRQRFSWAHELAHIVMADETSPQVACRATGKLNSSLETCCNIIAAEILMPRSVFSESADQLGWSLDAVRGLAHTFQVSFQAAARRLAELFEEALLFSVWRLKAGQPLHQLKYSWAMPNAEGKKRRPQVHWQTDSRAMAALYRAISGRGVVSGISKVLMKVDGESRYNWVQTEAMAVGRGDKCSVFGFHYLARTGPFNNGREAS